MSVEDSGALHRRYFGDSPADFGLIYGNYKLLTDERKTALGYTKYAKKFDGFLTIDNDPWTKWAEAFCQSAIDAGLQIVGGEITITKEGTSIEYTVWQPPLVNGNDLAA